MQKFKNSEIAIQNSTNGVAWLVQHKDITIKILIFSLYIILHIEYCNNMIIPVESITDCVSQYMSMHYIALGQTSRL